ncbi:VOC family metalloprotein YjdN [Erwinia sp. P7711]|uniref:VOC family metalloprotein YjdN n=1 Tax=Erwinia sp. P7711 TaxID=3141451 RepID=UPI0031930506
MQLSPYLYFAGNCEEALTFYQQATGAKLAFKMTWGDVPSDQHQQPEKQNSPAAQQPADDKIMHALLHIGDGELQLSDSAEAVNYNGFAVSLSSHDVEEGKRWFDNLAEGGSVTLAWKETFWALGFGTLVDKFGIPWRISVNKPASN